MKNKAKRLFTLVELLIVVAIVLILLSLIQPALQKALKQARLTLCINNMRQNVMTMVLYSDDHKGLAWDSAWHDNYGLTVLRYKATYPTIIGPIPEGDYSKGSDPYDMRTYLSQYLSNGSHSNYEDVVSNDSVDFPTWSCPEVDSPGIDDKNNIRGSLYSNYFYFPGNRYPVISDSPDPHGLIRSDWTNLPRRFDLLADFVVQQDHISLLDGELYYNHGSDIIDDFNMLTYLGKDGENNPSASWRTGDIPEGSVMAWGDGSARWTDFFDMVKIGPIQGGRNNWDIYSLPPGYR